MDKKIFGERSLAQIMSDQIPKLKFFSDFHQQPTIQIKADGTPVTELDLTYSKHIEELMEESFPGFTFYSEENFSDWKFPLLALDPLDGTQEYIEGRNEWAISIGLLRDQTFNGEGWIYNPKTGECFSEAENRGFVLKPSYVGEVSRSEWKNGLFTKRQSETFSLKPVGSIAYKLGRLSAGKSDFVVSLRPKNIWDIAGGTLLCYGAGMKFYSEGKEVTSVEKTYPPPLLWCRPELFAELSKIYP